MSSAALVLAIGFVMLFSPPQWDEAGLLWWLAVSLVIVYGAHSLISICYMTWGARLTDEVSGRARVTAWREAFGLIGVVLASILPSFWVRDLGDRAGYQLFAWVFVVLLFVGLTCTLAFSPMPRVACEQRLEGWRRALAPKGVRRILWFYFFVKFVPNYSF